MTEREESDQLPEEGPAGQVPDDEGGSGSVREDAEKNEGGAQDDDSDEGQSTGNPRSAG
jgi:hypothetical protein